ncbi:MAG: ABC transporter permease [Planctomycetota bacterium JB042]
MSGLFDRWTWAMAWRDSRRVRGRLLLFVSCMTVGVAALVAISSFGENLQSAVAAQSKSMLGADLRVRSNDPWPAEVDERLHRTLLDEHDGDVSEQLGFASMALFPGQESVRLVQVRALQGSYPYYGALETDPPAAAERFRTARDVALVDAALLSQVGASVGDEVRVGDVGYEIGGALTSIPGASATTAMFGPRVYLPRDGLDPALLQKGSRIRYERYYRLGDGADPQEISDDWRDFARDHQLRLSTVESTEENLSESMDDLTGFLNLVGFVALLLGGLGVASAISVHVRAKTAEVATLRCLGASSGRTFSIWLAQALVLGLIGAVVGGGIGVLVQRTLPLVLGSFLPMEVPVFTSWRAVAFGGVIAVTVALAFALLPLLPLRRIPPLLALRAQVEPPSGRRDPARMLALLAIVLGIWIFALEQTGELDQATGYTVGLVAAFLVLSATAFVLRRAVRRFFPRRFPWEWRQGLANLDRPSNQTGLLLVSIGLGTFLVLTLFQARALLLAQVESITEGEQPNVVLFDVQDDQLDGVRSLVAESGAPVMESVPIVTMRILSVRGRSAREMRDDRDDGIPGWVVRREYRSTYRDAPSDLETIVDGTFVGRADPADGPVPVSIATRIADDLKLEVGDSIVWDVQGAPIETVVGSIRDVDWRRMRPNFFAVFPTGVLERAPKFHVVVTRAEGPEAIGGLQRAVVAAYPNVSAIDVTLVLKVVDDLLAQVSFVVRFMAAFSVLTGLLVLVSSILTSRYQRLEESVLLRTLGATRRRVARILDVEHLLVGFLAAATGAVLSLGGAWALAAFQFEVSYAPDLPATAAAILAIPLLTLVLGRLTSRGLADAPPLEVLRYE